MKFLLSAYNNYLCCTIWNGFHEFWKVWLTISVFEHCHEYTRNREQIERDQTDQNLFSFCQVNDNRV